MNKVSFLFLALLVSLYTNAKGPNAVVILTDSNIEEEIKKNDVIMIKFFAPECEHCKALKPEYKAVANKLKEQGKSYVLAEIDGTIHIDASDRYQIQGFPTLKLFIKGRPKDYEGERKADEILAFIERKAAPPSTELTLEQLKTKKTDKGLRVFLSSDLFRQY